MLLFVDLEHPRYREVDPADAQRVAAARLRAKYLLEDLTGEPCLLIRHDRFSAETVMQWQPKAIICSGCMTHFHHYTADALAGLHWLLTTVPVPTLTICGSFQLMGQWWGAEIGPMDDPQGENGWHTVALHHAPEALAAHGPTLRIWEHHGWEMKTIPDAFIHWGSTVACPIQGVAHRTLPLWGVQFHPEENDENENEGRDFLAAFWSMAQAWQKSHPLD